MASREYDISEDCAEIWGISDPLLDELDHKLLQWLVDEDDGDLEEKWWNMTEFERKEYVRQMFLEEFPAERVEIECCIRHLLEMADAIDETHKKCTIANIAANSTSASSGILTILGMTLAPFTAGGSLIMTATGLGLGAVAAAAGASASIYESVSTSKEAEKAEELTNGCGRSLRMALCPDEADFSPENENVANPVPQVAGTVFQTYRAVKGIKANVKALKCIQANTGLKGLANRATEVGRAFWGKIWGAKPAEKVLSGSTLALSKGARLLGAAAAGAFVVFDAYNIAQNAKHLTEGAQAETAAEIRKKARKLEAELQELIKLYEAIQVASYHRHRKVILEDGKCPTGSSCGSWSYPLPTRPQWPTQRAPTKPTRASHVDQRPMQQTITGSPPGFQKVGSSGSLRAACPQQKLRASASTKFQWNLQENQAEGTVFQGGGICTPTYGEKEGNAGARELSEPVVCPGVSPFRANPQGLPPPQGPPDGHLRSGRRSGRGAKAWRPPASPQDWQATSTAPPPAALEALWDGEQRLGVLRTGEQPSQRRRRPFRRRSMTGGNNLEAAR